MNANFFWRGDDFQFLNRLTVKSHLAVGHDVIVWLSGKTPRSKYWIDDLNVTIRNAAEVFNVEPFLKTSRNLRAASDLWSYHFLYENGGLYCDMDHVALKKFPDDPWIRVSGNEGQWISGGLIKSPPSHPVFLGAIKNFEDPSRRVFGDACRRHDLKITHKNEDFYPFPWYRREELFKEKPLPDSYSLHLYFKFLSKLHLTPEIISEKYPNSMLERLVDRFEG